MRTIPVKYVGLRDTWEDDLYGSHVIFTRGKVSKTPEWAAARLLKHPEFEDARPADKQDALNAEQPGFREAMDQQLEELQQLEANVRLDNMNMQEIGRHIVQVYGVRLDSVNQSRADLIQQANLIINRNRVV